ncbi:hypothetical protein PR048_010933 [Dryococelus australis]|uniref:Uncharacterized protein n=1 Tax=Dryococelus australis TaxID=614101 RepID=A0ABQ9HKH6_9NEOP|nr:hypothetical protein PR048_010933 [Dryococelus australis]
MGYKKAATVFNVLRTILFRMASMKYETHAEATQSTLGRRPVFPPELEILNRKMRLTYQLAVVNDIPNIFSKQNETAGRKWLELFILRHQNVITSSNRAKGFNNENVATFLIYWYLKLPTDVELSETEVVGPEHIVPIPKIAVKTGPLEGTSIRKGSTFDIITIQQHFGDLKTTCDFGERRVCGTQVTSLKSVKAATRTRRSKHTKWPPCTVGCWFHRLGR